jgi:hypothetical protein
MAVSAGDDVPWRVNRNQFRNFEFVPASHARQVSQSPTVSGPSPTGYADIVWDVPANGGRWSRWVGHGAMLIRFFIGGLRWILGCDVTLKREIKVDARAGGAHRSTG